MLSRSFTAAELLLLLLSSLSAQGGVLDNTLETGDNLFKTEPLVIIGSGAAGSLLFSAFEPHHAEGFLKGRVFTSLDKADNLLFGAFLPAAAAGVWAAGAISDSPEIERTGESLCRGLLYSYGFTGCLKFTVGRERPDGSDYRSFPSAHAAGAACTAAVLWVDQGPSAGIPAGLLALYTCFSRVNLARHHPSDVLMGAAIGTACGIAAAQVTDPGEPSNGTDRGTPAIFSLSITIDSSGRITPGIW